MLSEGIEMETDREQDRARTFLTLQPRHLKAWLALAALLEEKLAYPRPFNRSASSAELGLAFSPVMPWRLALVAADS